MVASTSNSQNHFLSELLPYKLESKPSKEIPHALKEYQFLIEATLQTNKELKKGHFSQFDPIVRDTSCHQRAAYIAKYALSCRESLREKKLLLKDSLNRIQSIFENNKKKYWFNQFSLIDLFNSNALEIPMTEEEINFVMCYMLTKVKKINAENNCFQRTEQTKQTLLSDILKGISKSFCIKIVDHLQIKLAKASVEFVTHLALHSQDPDDRQMTILTADDGLQCSPCFRSLKVILEWAKGFLPLIVIAQVMPLEKDRIIKEVVIYYQSNGSDWLEHHPTHKEMSTPAFIIQGATTRQSPLPLDTSDWHRIFSNNAIQDLVLACGAVHNQYPKSILNKHPNPVELSENDHLLTSFKEKAPELCCTRDNPKTFMPFHMFCGTLGDLVYRPLLKYHDFYASQFVKGLRIKKWSLFKNTIYDTGFRPLTDGSRIKLFSNQNQLATNTCQSTLEETKERIRKEDVSFFQFKPELQTDHTGHLFLNLLITGPTFGLFSMRDLLDYAMAYPNPSEFLLDHRAFWDCFAVDIIEYLISQSQNFDNQDLIEVLFECYKKTLNIILLDNSRGKVRCLQGLVMALKVENLREKARNFLVELAGTADVQQLEEIMSIKYSI